MEFPNIPPLSNQPLLERFEAAFPGLVFHLENDANAAALGELYFACTSRPDSFLFVTLGTGVGGALVLDRKIFLGADGNALEIGHILVGNGRTLEQNIGKTGLLKWARHYHNKYKNESGLDLESLDAKILARALKKNDIVAKKVFKKAGVLLGEGLVAAVRLFDVKTILMGGGVSGAFAYMEPFVHKSLDEHLTPYYQEKIQIVPAELGNNAGIIGAASLCFMD